MDVLRARNWEPDYISVRRREDLQPQPRLMTRSSFWLPRNWEERA